MKSFFLIIALAAGNMICFAQTDTPATVDSVHGKSTLTLAALYANNASYYGQKAAARTPYFALAAVYQLRSGIYFTGQSYKLLNDNTSTVSATSFGAGVNFKLSKKLTTDLSYSHSFYPSYSPLLQAANVDNASLTFAYDAWVKPTLTADYAFGKVSDAFVTAGLSKSVDLFSISKKDIINIAPSADIVGGTQHFYQTYVKQQKLHDSILGVVAVPPVFGNPRNTNHIDTVATTNFNVLSYNFKIPLSYNRSHYILQAEYQLSLLSDHVAANKQMNSFLTFSFYYQF
ncbi:MAG: hypothetical protein ABI091_11815 [Ferruginibacter sp.]|jgi:hypothetical protein